MRVDDLIEILKDYEPYANVQLYTSDFTMTIEIEKHMKNSNGNLAIALDISIDDLRDDHCYYCENNDD